MNGSRADQSNGTCVTDGPRTVEHSKDHDHRWWDMNGCSGGKVRFVIYNNGKYMLFI